MPQRIGEVERDGHQRQRSDFQPHMHHTHTIQTCSDTISYYFNQTVSGTNLFKNDITNTPAVTALSILTTQPKLLYQNRMAHASFIFRSPVGETRSVSTLQGHQPCWSEAPYLHSHMCKLSSRLHAFWEKKSMPFR